MHSLKLALLITVWHFTAIGCAPDKKVTPLRAIDAAVHEAISSAKQVPLRDVHVDDDAPVPLEDAAKKLLLSVTTTPELLHADRKQPVWIVWFSIGGLDLAGGAVALVDDRTGKCILFRILR
jgi:hypothetical protein